jgi:hypothetical protein
VVPNLEVPAPVDFGDHIHNGDPRLRLVAEREFVPQVPFRLDETKKIDAVAYAPVDQLGPVLQQQVPVVTGSDFASLLAAFNKRCNFVSEDRVAPSIVKSSTKLADRVFTEIRPFDWTQDIFDRWNSKFPRDKQVRMEKALLSIHDCDFSSINTKELMVKGEVLLKRNDPSWAPRVIYVGSDEYNVLTGPIMDEFNKRLCEALDTFRDRHVAKVIFAYTKDDVTIATALMGSERYFEGDFSANDRSQLSDVSRIFAHWLRRCGAPKWFVSFYLKNSHTFRVRSYEYGVSAELKYQLATGGTDTTARNTVWNFCLWHSFCELTRVFGSQIAVLGDDIAAGTDSKGIDLLRWQKHCGDAGMRLKAQERRFYCDLTFLSRFFVPIEERACMVPLIGKALMRFNARANRNQDVSDAQYMAGKSLSYAYEFRHVAYMRDKFLSRFSACQVDFEDVKLHDLTWFAKQGVKSIDDVYHKIRSEPLVLSDDAFLDVVMAKYDVGLYDMDFLTDRLILDTAAEVFSDERYHNFAHEVE